MVKNADTLASGSCFLLLTRHKNDMSILGGYEVKPRFPPKNGAKPHRDESSLQRRINID